MHVRKFVPALLCVVGFLSCSASVDFWDQRSVQIQIPSGGPYVVSGAPQTVDLSSDAEIASQLKDISSIDVEEIWLQVTAVDPSNVAEFASGSVSVAAPNADPTVAANWQVLGNYQSLPISLGGTIEVVPTAEQEAVITQIQTWAETTPFQFQIQYAGSFTDANGNALTTGAVNFTVESRIHLLATVNASL